MKKLPISLLMNKTFIIIVSIFTVLSFCKSFQQDTIIKSQSQLTQSQSIEEKNKIVENMYKKKDSVPENQKKDYIDFFIYASKETPLAISKLIALYNDPLYKNYKNYIFDQLIEQIEDPEVFSFIEKEIYKNPDLYNIKLKQKILQSKNKTLAEFLLNMIYLNKEILDPEIIYLFKETKLEESLPVLIQSIEKNQFVEECFSAISSIPTEEAQTFIINVASDYQHPYREIALGYLSKIDNKKLAYSVYFNILKNYHLEKDTILFKTLNSLKQIIPYLDESQKQEILTQLEKLKNNINLEKPIKELSLLLGQPIESIKKETDLNNEKQLKEIPEIKKAINKDLVLKQKQNKTEQKSNHKKPQHLKKKKVPHKAFYSKSYANKISKELEFLFLDDYKETQLNLHNALLTYAKSNSEKAKFIINAYREYYKIQNEEEIRELLSQGLFINQSIYGILSYVKKQYKRNDLQIYALTQLFAIKRKHAEKILENINRFK
ncbi:MAG: hypothetical protein KatS3mg129_2251 [Leptospiraceae bacterium]|nr:MAG: hypothetical protein KatS3mg129_2251 [Leptospiraceae bacterium]